MSINWLEISTDAIPWPEVAAKNVVVANTKNSISNLFLWEWNKNSLLSKLLRPALASLFWKEFVDGFFWREGAKEMVDNKDGDRKVNIDNNTAENVFYPEDLTPGKSIDLVGNWENPKEVALSALSALRIIEKNEWSYDLVKNDWNDISLGKYQLNTYWELPAFLTYLEKNSWWEKQNLAIKLNRIIKISKNKNGQNQVEVFRWNHVLINDLKSLASLTEKEQTLYKSEVVLKTVRDIPLDIKAMIGKHQDLKNILVFILDTQNWTPEWLRIAYNTLRKNPGDNVLEILISGRAKWASDLDKKWLLNINGVQTARVWMHEGRIERMNRLLV